MKYYRMMGTSSDSKAKPRCSCGLILTPDICFAADSDVAKIIYGDCVFATEECTKTPELINNICEKCSCCISCIKKYLNFYPCCRALQGCLADKSTFKDLGCGCELAIDYSLYYKADPEAAAELVPNCIYKDCPRKAQIINEKCGCGMCLECPRE